MLYSLQVVDSPRSPSFTYDKDVCQFALHLPKVTDFHRKEFYEAFKDALLTVFDDKAASELEEDWGQIHQAEVSKTATPPAARLGSRLPPALQVPAYLPSLASLPRPEELMAAPPYHIIVHGSGGSELQVQGTHSPSLELMKEYLTKWCRVNPNRSDGVSRVCGQLCHVM